MNKSNDDLVDEAREAGQAYINTFGGDLARVCADPKRQAAASGDAVIERPAQSPCLWQAGENPSAPKALQ